MAASAGARRQTRIVVGSAESCEIIIRDPKVSKQHCELVWQDDAWHLRDLSSTNGTFVDGRRINQRIRLTSENEVTLGRNVKLKIPPQPVTLEPPDKPASFASGTILQTQHTKPILIGGATILSLLLLIGLVGWLGSSHGSMEDKSNSANVPSTSQTVSDPISVTKPNLPSPAIDGADPKTVSNSVTSESAKQSPYWAVLAVSGKDQSKRLIGNAVAVGPHHLITLASITEAVEEVKEQFPKLVLTQGSSSKSLTPTRIKSHPAYQPALDTLKKFEKDLQARLNQIGDQAEPSLEESLEWSNKLDSIMEEIACVELACIECPEKLQSYLTIQPAGPIASDTKLSLVGYPMILPNPLIDQNLPSFLLQGQATVVSEQSNSAAKLMITTSDFSGFPFLSLACTTDDKRLLGLVVRQPQSEGINSTQTGKLVRVEEFWK